MKTARIHLSNSKVSGEDLMTVKQAKFLQHLFLKKAIDNPFTCYKDMKCRLSKTGARRTIDGILNGEEIVWVIPGE
jgi:hypothetical protein